MKLNCYASGDGALHFCWVEDGKATGRKVTKNDAVRYLKGKDAEHFREKNHRVVMLNGLPALVANIKRVDEEHLNINGTVYKCLLKQDRNHDWIGDDDLTITTIDPRSLLTINVRHLSTRSSIRHFLEHEKALTDTF